MLGLATPMEAGLVALVGFLLLAQMQGGFARRKQARQVAP